MDELSTRRAQIVFVGCKGSGKTSLYQCLKSPNPHFLDVPSCSVLVEDWKPFDLETSPVAEECRNHLEGSLSDEDLNATVQVWDICGHESLWTCQQLCISPRALFVLVFNVRNPIDARLVPQWVQMIQAKCVGAHVIIAATNCEASELDGQNVLNEVEKMESLVLGRIQEELKALRELKSDAWVQNRVERLERIAQQRPNVCSTVFLTSAVTGKGLSDLRRAILKHLFDNEKFSFVRQILDTKEMELVDKIGAQHDGKNMVMSLEDFREIACCVGLSDEEELEKAIDALANKGFLTRVNIAETLHEPNGRLIVVDPCCFASACTLVHRDEENPQDFVNRLQKSSLVQRFWPTSTRPNDWTLRSAIEDILDRGMVRESFLPLCFQKWDLSEDDIKKLLPVLLKLGVLADGAQKAGYEIELALSYFKNLSVTKRYHLPLLLKLPKEPQALWSEKTPDSFVSVGWQYRFQEGVSAGLLLSIVAACKNDKPCKTVRAHWQTGVILRVGDVDICIKSLDRVLDLNARCRIANGSKQSLNMVWLTLAKFLYIIESYLSNFPGLYYQFFNPSDTDLSTKNIYQSIQDHLANSETSLDTLWVLPPYDIIKQDELSVPFDILTWVKLLSRQSSIYISHQDSLGQEVKLLSANLELCGFDVALGGGSEESKRKKTLGRCALVILFLTNAYLDESSFKEDFTVAQSSRKHIIAARFEPELTCDFSNVVWVDLSHGTGSGISHAFDPEQLRSLTGECRNFFYGRGDVENSSSSPSELTKEPPPEPLPALTPVPAMEPCRRPEDAGDETRRKKAGKKKRQVQFSPETENNATLEDNQIKPLAACTVAAAMVGAAAEHLSLCRKTSSASVRAANATAKVARAVANGNADAATEALNDVIRIVDNLSSSAKQKSNGLSPPPKSKTCAIL